MNVSSLMDESKLSLRTFYGESIPDILETVAGWMRYENSGNFDYVFRYIHSYYDDNLGWVVEVAYRLSGEDK